MAKRKQTFLLLTNPHGSFWWTEPSYNHVKQNIASGEWKVVEKAKAVEYQDLDFTKTSLFRDTNDSNDSGWLSPAGVYHGCGFGNHVEYAGCILKRAGSDLENEGWIHIDGAPFVVADRPEKQWSRGSRFGGRLTAEQRNWLLDRGHFVEDND